LNRPNDGTAVVVGNPKGEDFQNLRVSLFPGLFNVVKYSKQVALPLRIFLNCQMFVVLINQLMLVQGTFDHCVLFM